MIRSGAKKDSAAQGYTLHHSNDTYPLLICITIVMQLWFLILDNHYSIEMVTNPRKWFARQPLDGPGSQYF